MWWSSDLSLLVDLRLVTGRGLDVAVRIKGHYTETLSGVFPNQRSRCSMPATVPHPGVEVV